MIGENIKTYRQKKGYTQEEVANRLHVTRQTISKWEKNYSVPDAEVFVKLADVLEVQTSQLLEVKVDSDMQTTEEKQKGEKVVLVEKGATKRSGGGAVITIASALLLVL